MFERFVSGLITYFAVIGFFYTVGIVIHEIMMWRIRVIDRRERLCGR